MKPKPFSALNHFTVPGATCAPTFRATDDPSRSGGRVFRSSARQNERGTRTARKGTTRKPGKQVLHAESTSTFCELVPRSGDDRPPDSADETRLARGLQRRAHPVRGTDDRLQRVER